jgi:hypothetical protein
MAVDPPLQPPRWSRAPGDFCDSTFRLVRTDKYSPGTSSTARSLPMPCPRWEPSERTIAAAMGIASTPPIGCLQLLARSTDPWGVFLWACCLGLVVGIAGIRHRSWGFRQFRASSWPGTPVLRFTVRSLPEYSSFPIVCVEALGFTYGPLAWLLEGVRWRLIHWRGCAAALGRWRGEDDRGPSDGPWAVQINS